MVIVHSSHSSQSGHLDLYTGQLHSDVTLKSEIPAGMHPFSTLMSIWTSVDVPLHLLIAVTLTIWELLPSLVIAETMIEGLSGLTILKRPIKVPLVIEISRGIRTD
jgi:hypothetical protein